MTLLSLEAYTHPRSIETFVRMLDAWGWWENEFFAPFRAARDGIRQLGRRAREGAFSRFAERIARASLRLGRRHVVYDSPSQGSLELGWTGPLRRAGQPLALGDFPRYSSPWSQAEFPSDEIEIRHGLHTLRLRWPDARREASGFL